MIQIEEFGFQWHITDRCNRRCRHCYQDFFDHSREPSIDSLIKLANHIAGTLPSIPLTINLTGGEPLLVPGIERFLRHLGDMNSVGELNLITNATCIHDEMLRALADIPRLSSVKVSLESDCAEINDWIRGNGHFELVTTNIEKLCKIKPVVLMVTLAKYNLGCIRGLCHFARARGIDGVIFERYVPLGKGSALADQVLSAGEWMKAVRDLCEETGVDANPTELLPFKAYRVDTGSMGDSQRELLQGALCNLGPESMALMPNGAVYPCRRMPIPVGHLPQDSMQTIVARLACYHPQALSRKLGGPACSRCEFGEACAGCRALTLALGGSLFDDDPQCVGVKTQASN